MILQNRRKRKNIVVALSGGVDSAVAALLCARAGARVRAVFMKNWRDNDKNAACHDKGDLIAAAAVADFLRLPFEVAEFVDDYRQQVFDPFLRGLQDGQTPNPDVLCNARIKFSAFANYARAEGADAIATGHYARVERLNGQWRLCRGEDAAKDQTYFLHRLSQEQLAFAEFPLARLHKSETRKIARDAGLANWRRKDSVGICFVGKRDFSEFLQTYLPEKPGDIVDENGQILGKHRGLHFYTIGQRHGLQMGGRATGCYVAGKDTANNRLLVVGGNNHPLLWSETAQLVDTHWIAGTPPPPRWVVAARLRHRQPPASCVLTRVAANRAALAFAEPQRAVTPGQYAVVYDGNVCLGGGAVSYETPAAATQAAGAW